MFPFRIHTVRTDRGYAFQVLFHWHLVDQGIQHDAASSPARSPEPGHGWSPARRVRSAGVARSAR